MTYGIRWDVDFAPATLGGPQLPAVTGFDLNDLSKLTLAPAGTPPFRTGYHNLAPRLGLAYQLSQAADWGTTIRGGFGLFYDLATQEVGNSLFSGTYPFGSTRSCPNPVDPGCPANVTFPLNPSVAAPAPISPANLAYTFLGAFDPHLSSPYTLQWNVALEQGLGKQQTISASYIGSAGRRLIQSARVFFAPNPNIPFPQLVANGATSSYNALQLQFQRRLSHGLQSLVSYTWAHSIDTASAGSVAVGSNALLPGNGNANRGPSDFDVRNGLAAAITYDIPTFKSNNKWVDSIVRSWSLQSIIHAQSASPVNVFETSFDFLKGFVTQLRPDVVAGIPFYLYGSQYPGGKAINGTPGAVSGGCPDGSSSIGPFCPPPVGPDGLPTQGNLGRNALRGFGLTQWDLSVHRSFAIHESVKLQFRAEMFNVLNHPNFGPPSGCLSFCGIPFGVASHTLAQSLGANVGTGGFDPLYQLGGPRSIQLALKLSF